ncbi:hypothetical protein Vafri_19305, partial [Volvox africanus]
NSILPPIRTHTYIRSLTCGFVRNIGLKSSPLSCHCQRKLPDGRHTADGDDGDGGGDVSLSGGDAEGGFGGGGLLDGGGDGWGGGGRKGGGGLGGAGDGVREGGDGLGGDGRGQGAGDGLGGAGDGGGGGGLFELSGGSMEAGGVWSCSRKGKWGRTSLQDSALWFGTSLPSLGTYGYAPLSKQTHLRLAVGSWQLAGGEGED